MTRRSFSQDETGAVTVDWVVLTAAIVGLGIATYGVVSSGVKDVSGNVGTHLEQDWIDTSFAQTGAVDGLSALPMRVFTDAQRTESAETMAGYSDATLNGMIGQFEIMTQGQDLTTDPYAAMADSLDIAKYERARRG